MKKVVLILLILFSLGAAVAQQKQSDEQLGIQYYVNKEYEKATELFSKVYNKNPNTYIYYYYYQALIYLEDYKELEKVVKKQIKTTPNSQRFKVDLGYVYERSNNHAQAIKEYEAAIRNLPANTHVIKELYNAFLAKGLREYAIQTISQGRKLLNDDKLLSKELTDIYIQLNYTDKIIDEAMNLVQDGESQYLSQAETILQNVLTEDENQQIYLTLKTILQKNIQKYPANDNYVSLLFWLYKLNKDYPSALVLSKAIDKKLKGDGEVVFQLAKEASNNRDYETAIAALDFIIAKGEPSTYYSSARFELLNVKYKQLTSSSPVKILDALLLEKEFKKLLDESGLHSGTFEWTRKYAHLLAFYVNKPEEAVTLLNQAIANSDRLPREKAVYKTDLADILLYMGSVWDATLLYSQVDKDFPNDTIGHFAKFKNAKLSFYIGEFKWAKSQLDVLRAATSKLIANDAMYFSLLISDNEEDEEEEEEGENMLFQGQNDYNKALKYFARADFFRFQNKDNEALAMLDSALFISPIGPLVDDILFQKAQLSIRQGNYLQAEGFLQKLLQTHAHDILGDDATFLLAELYEYYLKDSSRAMEYYQKLMKEYPGSLFTIDARKRFRTLRGDNL